MFALMFLDARACPRSLLQLLYGNVRKEQHARKASAGKGLVGRSSEKSMMACTNLSQRSRPYLCRCPRPPIIWLRSLPDSLIS